MNTKVSRANSALLFLILIAVIPGLISAVWRVHAHTIIREQMSPWTAPQDSSTGSAMEEGNAQRSRVIATKGLQAPPRELVWKSERLFQIRTVITERFENGPYKMVADFPTNYDFTVPVVSSGVLFFTLYMENSFFYAIDAQTGRQLVTLRFERNWLSPPAVLGRVAYFGSGTGRVYAYDADANRMKWSFEKKGHSFAYASPAIEDGTVYFLGWRLGLHAFRADTGEQKWTYQSKEDFYRPAIKGKYVILVSPKGPMLAINKDTGSKEWETKIDRDTSPPAILDDQIFSVRDNGEIRAYDIADGTLRWKSEQKAGTLLALFDRTVFFAGRVDSVVALDAETGKEKWLFKTKQRCYAPVVVDGTLLTGCSDKKYHALELNTGKEKWFYDNKKSVPPSPAFADGIMYVLGSDGLLTALR